MTGALFGEALRALRANRLRTALTMLGIIIGVGAVIVMLAVGHGAQSVVSSAIASMGSNLLIILPGASTASGQRLGFGTNPTLTVADAEALAELPQIAATAPVVSGNAQMVYGPSNWSAQVIGTTPNYLEIRAWTLAEGAEFTATDLRSATRVALVGQTAARNLFGETSPLGKTLRIKNSPFQVVGVLAAKGQSLDGRDQDDVVIVPLTTAQRRLFGRFLGGTIQLVLAQATSADAMASAERESIYLLRQRHRIREGQDNDFWVRNLTALAETAAESTRMMAIMLGSIASVSLLVGGIGIMNIMLVSVTERTREIGIRVAVGAHRRHILAQFLIEALLISLAGSLLGVALGIGGAQALSGALATPTIVTGWSIGVSCAVAATVGVFFGFYPAHKAAYMNPIEALRYQ